MIKTITTIGLFLISLISILGLIMLIIAYLILSYYKVKEWYLVKKINKPKT